MFRFDPSLQGQAIVPRVLNQRAPNAQQTLRGRGLGFRVAGFVNTNNQGLHNRVARQSPGPNARVRQGTVVSVTLFTAQQGSVTVPNVLNQTLGVAQSALLRQGLRFRVAGSVNTGNRGQTNRVARQSPGPNARVGRGTVVGLTLYRFAQAPPPQGAVVVPSVVNQPIQNAIRILRQAGLRPGSAAFVPSRDPNRNLRVRTQSPRAGARINRGGRVDLVVFFHSP